MTTAAADTQHTPGDIYLQQIASLHEEMTKAILAISGDSLAALEESLCNQEFLCVSLKRLLQALPAAQIDADCMAGIRSAMASMRSVNQTYAELVRQARTPAEVLYQLCLSYKNVSAHELPCDNGRLCSYEA